MAHQGIPCKYHPEHSQVAAAFFLYQQAIPLKNITCISVSAEIVIWRCLLFHFVSMYRLRLICNFFAVLHPVAWGPFTAGAHYSTFNLFILIQIATLLFTHWCIAITINNCCFSICHVFLVRYIMQGVATERLMSLLDFFCKWVKQIVESRVSWLKVRVPQVLQKRHISTNPEISFIHCREIS